MVTCPIFIETSQAIRRTTRSATLSGEHYVDDDTLRGFHSRIISARHTDGGLLFAIVTSDAKDFENRSRGFRYVIFDLFGTVIERNPSSVDREYFRTSEKAEKAMWAALNSLNAAAITRAGIEQAENNHAQEMERCRADLAEMIAANKTKAA